MTRVSYLKKCGLIENFCTERRKTYEPLIMVPLAYGKGKLEFFREPLYRYNRTAVDLFRFRKFEDCEKYYNDYLYLYDWSIGKLNAPEDAKRRLKAIARLSYYKELMLFIPDVADGEAHTFDVAQRLSNMISELFEPAPRIEPANILKAGLKADAKSGLKADAKSGLKAGISSLFTALEHNILGEAYPLPRRRGQFKGRVIAYGALGSEASKLLPALNDSEWRPSELWDKKGDGVLIKRPDFSSLTSADVILFFPVSVRVIKEFTEELGDSPARVFFTRAIRDLITQESYPELENARLK